MFQSLVSILTFTDTTTIDTLLNSCCILKYRVRRSSNKE